MAGLLHGISMVRNLIISCEEVIMTRKVVAVCVILFGLMGLAAADPIEVPEGLATIQEAIDHPDTVDGSVIVVGPVNPVDPCVPVPYDVPNIEGNRDIDFRGKAITVRSRYGPAYCTIDLQWAGHAFYFHSGETNSSVVQGFTIKNGHASFGGAIECANDSSPVIRDCIIYNNHANYYGGGIECYNASPTIFNCLFHNNSAGHYGGAIDCDDASPEIKNCTFVKNRADLDGGGIFSSWSSQPEVINCIFQSCSSHAIYEYPQTLTSDVVVMTSLFYENHIDPCDPCSPLADYYDADMDSTYAGEDELEDIPDGYVLAVYDNKPHFTSGPLSASLEEPLGDFYLSQVAAGQLRTSICVDHGYTEAIPNVFASDPDYNYTTATDNREDDGALDIGYHYRQKWPLNEYYLVTEVWLDGNADGTIDPYHAWPGVAYKEFSEVRLTPLPADNSKVTWWEGTEQDGAPVLTTQYPQGEKYNSVKIISDNIDIENKIIVAVEFSEQADYQLTATVDGAGGQIQIITPPDIGTDRYYEYAYVELQAIPDEDYVVRSWTGVSSVSWDMTHAWVLMDRDRTVHVEFITDYVELTVLFNLSLGTVRPRSGRYPYPTPGQPPVVETLEASPIPGYRVGAYRVNDGDWIIWHENLIDVPMDDNKIVEVWFEPISSYPLIVHVLPSSDGQIHGSVNPTSGLYLEGTVVQLDATADQGYAPIWSGVDSSDPNGAQVTIVGPETIVEVTFEMGSQLDDVACVYSPLPDGEPDWASGPKGCYTTIQDAIDAAVTGIYGPWVIEGDPEATPLPIIDLPESPGDIVVVKDGTHRGDGNRDLNFYGKLITVRSEFGPENCIIDCEGTPGDPHRAFYFSDLENNASVVDGFTIRGGYAEEFGGAFAIGVISRPVINNCIIQNNHAGIVGGGVYFQGPSEDDISFYEDWADETDAEATELENALDFTDPCALPSLDDIIAAIAARAMATFAQQIVDSIDDEEADRPMLTDCKIRDNNAAYNSVGYGGGIFCTNLSPLVIGTEISGNWAGYMGWGEGGGVYCEEASLAEFINCLVVNNYSTQGGGGFQLNDGSDAIILLCTVANNSGGTDLNSDDGIVCDEDTTPTISHCIVYHPYGNDLVNCDADEFSLVGQNPMFVTGVLGGYYLSHIETEGFDSLAVDLGDGDFLGTLQEPPEEEGGYGLPLNLTTWIIDRWENVATWDTEPTDAGYHYPFHGTDVRYDLTMYVIGNGTLYYGGGDVSGTVTAYTSGVVASFGPGTTVTLYADPECGYRVKYWYVTGADLSFAKWHLLTMYTLNQSIYSSDRIVVVEFEEVFNTYIEVPGVFPYIGIQDALDAARSGDTLVIAPGTYRGTGFRVFKNITITSTEPSNPDVVANTVIDCAGERWGFDLHGDNGLMYGSCGMHEPEVVLAGLSIINAHSGRLTALDGQDPGDPGYNGSSNFGQGVIIHGSHTVVNCVIRNCTVLGNHGGNGMDGGTGEGELPIGGAGGNAGDAGGAGIYVGSGNPLIKNCIIDGCVAEGGNGGDAGGGAGGSEEEPAWSGGDGGLPGNAYGAGIYYDYGTEPTFIDCTVTNCIAYGGNGGNGGVGGDCPVEQSGTGPGGDGRVPGLAWGGGVYCGPWSEPIFTGLTVSNCQAIGGQGGDGADGGPDFGGSGGYGGGTSYDPAQDKPRKHSATGGGVYCGPDSDAVFTNCRFENNSTTGSISGLGGFSTPENYQSQPRINYNIPSFGGGVYCEFPSEAIFTNCVVRGNETTFLNNQYTGYGGGLCFGGIEEPAPEWFDPCSMQLIGDDPIESEVELNYCDIIDNASPVGGGIYVTRADFDIADCNMLNNSSYRGGGMYSTQNLADITRCTIRGNIASQEAGAGQIDPCLPGSVDTTLYGSGGGLYLFMTDANVSDCVIAQNDAGGTGGGVYLGGNPEGISSRYYAAPKLKNCLIADNTALKEGAGVSCNFAAESTMSNCTIAGNRVRDIVSYGGGVCISTDSRTEVIDSIIWGNAANKGSQLAVRSGDLYYPTPSNLDITYSDIGPPHQTSELPFAGSSSPFTGGSSGGDVLIEAQTIYDQFDAGTERVKVIVSLTEPTAMRQATNWSVPESVDALRAEIAARQDAVLSSLTPAEFTLRHRFDNQAGFSGEVTLSGLNQLLNNPSVAHIEPVRILYVCLAQGIPLMNATAARQWYNGEGLAIAICDTGVDYTHPMLGDGGFPNDKVIGGYDFGDNDAEPMPNGDAAHGTCCAGLAAGDLGETGDYIGGVAHNAKIYALKISYQDTGSATSDAMIAAWDWCVTHKNDDPAHPIMVTSTSFGGGRFYNSDDADAYSPAMKAAADNANAIGITVLASSGNDYFTDSMGWPAAISSVISVGAVYDTSDQVIGYSNTADFLDILAPSEDAYTTDITGGAGYASGGYFPYFNGTSAACPYAAGAVASLQDAALAKTGRYLSPEEVREVLAETGDPVTDTKVDITKPRVNLGAAIGSLEYGPPVWVEDGCRLNGTVFYDFDPNRFRWDPAARNIQDDPLFIGDYFLSQIAAGQLVDSNCVDAGSDLASNLGLGTYTTMTNSGPDTDDVDMGYHHKLFTVPRYKLKTQLISTIGGDIDPNHPTGVKYDQYTMVPLSISPTPPDGYRVKWSGTDDDGSTVLTNTVTMDRDRVVTAEFEQYWYTLKIVIEGPGTVTADSNSVPYNDNYPPGAIVYLTADPNEGYKVRIWRGADIDPQWGGDTATVTMNRNRTVLVEFEPDVSDNLLVPIEYATIEEAVAAASSGDTIILQRRDTPYTVSDPCGIDFMGRAITIMSEYPHEPNCVAETVIDCQGSRFVPKRAFNFHSGEGRDSRIWGITIKNGFMPGAVGGSGVLPGYATDPCATPLVYSANNGAPATGDGYGGAILCKNGSSPTIENCVITNCSATGGQGGDGANGYYVPVGMEPPDGQWGGHAGNGYGNGYGGAIACRGGSRGGSNPEIINCIMSNNTTRGGCGGIGGNGSQKEDETAGNESWGGNGGNASGEGFGGAIYCDGKSSPIVVGCTFHNNIATSARAGQGGQVGPGAALDPPAGNGVRGTNTTSGITAGGAVYYGHDSDPNFINCTFSNNEVYDIYMILQYAFGETGVYGYVETPIYTKGGALYSEPNNVVTLDNCKFTDHLGGAVYCEHNCELDLDNCLFIKNQSCPQIEDYSLYYGAPGYSFNYAYYYDIETAPGGAIEVGSNCEVNIEDCVFANNYTYGNGGAIHSKSDAVLRKCTFGGNKARSKGGAVEAYRPSDPCNPIADTTLTLDFEACSFGGNEAVSGGAVSLQDFAATFADCYFVGNQAQSGGGLFVVDGTLAVTGGFISENQATGIVDPTPTGIVSEEAGCGGGVACLTSSATIADCVISNNTAEGGYSYGGGVSFYGGSDIVTHEVKNCLITGNRAGIGGGGISGRIFTSPKIANCTFEGNSAGSYGGGVFSDWTSQPRISDSIFVSCDKHAIYEEKVYEDAFVKYSLFYNNPDHDFYDAGTGESYTGDQINSVTVDSVENIEGNPMFVKGLLGDYYLDQGASAAVNAGSDLAVNLGMNDYTTDPDPNNPSPDTGTVDIGYHYGGATDVLEPVMIKIVMPDGHGEVQVFCRDAEHWYYGPPEEEPLVIEAPLGAMITINAYPDVGYRLASWSGGTVNDHSKELTNVVIATYHKTIEVRFEQPRTLFVGTVTGDEAHYTSIQHAIDDAVDGDVVIILPGEYIPAPPGASPYDDIRFYNKNITLTTSYPENPDDVVLRGYDFYIYDTGPGATIEGFTLTIGRMFLYRSSPTIRNCKFRDTNWIGILPITPEGCAQDGVDGVDIYGGAIAMYGSSPAIKNCTFEDMSVTGGPASGGNDGCEEHPGGGDGGWPGRGYGGAVYCAFSSNPTFEDCLFANCYASGGIGGDGGVGNEDPDGHGGRGGGWEYAPSIEDDPVWWYWWDGWTYGDKYLMWYSWGYNNYDWEKWGEWFDTSSWISWEDWYASYLASTSIYWQMTPYDAYEDHWEYSGYGGAVYCEYDSSPKFSGCVFEDNYSSGALSGIGALGGLNTVWPVPDRILNIETAGGAVYAANGSNPEFVDCWFTGNVADPNTIAADYDGEEPGEEESPFFGIGDDYYVSYGGAVAVEDGCAPKFTGCEFEYNEACEGGGLYVGGSRMTVADCDFVDNTAYHGAGLFTVSATGEVSGSVFSGNTARFNPAYVSDPCNPWVTLIPVHSQGGGYSCLSSPVDIRDSVFANNSAEASGGGIYYAGSDEDVSYAATPALSNCLLVQNSAGRDGGGVSSNWYAEPVISNCTIADNVVTGGAISGPGRGSGLYCSYYSNVTVKDSIIWDNVGVSGAQITLGSGNEYAIQPSTLEIKYSDIAGGQSEIQRGQLCELYWLDGNIDDDPLFVANEEGDYYYLSQIDSGQPSQSPCVDAGSNDAWELGLHIYTTRTNNNPDADDMIDPNSAIVDMGYHYSLGGAALESCSRCDIAPTRQSEDSVRLYGDGIINLSDLAVVTLYWYESCESNNPNLDWCPGFTLGDYTVGFRELTTLAKCWLEEDDQGPQPDPSEWEQEPYPDGPTSIRMTAKASSDNWVDQDVQYYFEETSGNSGCTDSGWQNSPEYLDGGLTPGTEYTYRIRTRDNKLPQPNMTEWSEARTTAASADIQPPSPVAWDQEPYAAGGTSISMSAQTATDPEGSIPVQYYFDCTTPGGHDRDWDTSTSYTDTGLTPNTEYCYLLGVRDGSLNEGWMIPDEAACATTEMVNWPPYPDGGVPGPDAAAAWDPDEVSGWSGQPREVATGHYMRADAAIDPPPDATGVWYYFECVSGEIPDSGWRSVAEHGEAAREFTFTDAPAGTNYCYRCKYRDTADPPAESAWSSTLCVP